jgi:hypothetical protein
MASTYHPYTALKIYSAIANSGGRGLDVQQLMRATNLARNTILIYTRRLAAAGCIEIQANPVQRKTIGHPRNIYVPIKPPPMPPDAADRLRLIVDLLEPISRHPDHWDKGIKGEIIWRIQEALKVATHSPIGAETIE